MAADDDSLREKAKLLVARERELFAMRTKHKRLSRWLELAQRLPALVDSKSGLGEICTRIAKSMMEGLDLQTVAFFEVRDGVLHRLVRPGAKGHLATELDAAALALITNRGTGTCAGSEEPAERSLCAAVGLHRFLWHCMRPAGTPTVLLAAGFDRARAQFYSGFDEDDIAHFSNTAHQLALLLGNNQLVRELEREKLALLQLNSELERRVEERTRQLGEALADSREKERRLDADVEQARLFQQKILPDAPRSPHFDVASEYRPLERVGGDVFDLYQERPSHLRAFVADATGHGVEASMRTILIKAEYDRLKIGGGAPHELLERLNARLMTLFPDGEAMCTGCVVDLFVEGDRARVVYANAGNPPLLHWAGAGEPILRYHEGAYLGIGMASWPDSLEFGVSIGHTLLVSSDGLFEQSGEGESTFEDRLRTTGMAPAPSLGDALASLLGAFDAFRGATPVTDDVTAVAIRVRSARRSG